MNKLSQLLSTHLLPVVTLFFALGIAAGSKCALTGPPLPELVFLLPLLTGGCVLLAHLRKQPRAALLLLPPFVVGLGFVHGLLAARVPPDPHHIFHLFPQGQEAVLICTLDRLPGFNGEKSTLIVDIHSLRLQDSPDFITAHGLAQLKLKAPWPKGLMPGDRLAIRARLDRPGTYHNPGSFDYPTFLAREDIWITGRIISPLHIYKLEHKPSFLHQTRSLPERLRTRIAAFIEQTGTPEISSVYKALLIGEASGISRETLEAFKGSGTFHILSISGAHLSILATFLFVILYWLLRRSEYLILRYPVKKIAAALCLPPLALYTLLAGANTPVVRSLIMVTVFMAALCADKRKSLFIPLALAALLILIWDPNSLFTASFQLSFAAVAAIAFVAPLIARFAVPEKKEESLLKRVKNRFLHFTLAAITVSLAATIGTAPLLFFYFNRISLLGPVANLPIESLICLWSLPLGFLACPLIFTLPAAATTLLNLGSHGLTLSLKLATFFNNLSFSTLWLPTPSPFLIALSYAAILIALSGGVVRPKVRMLAAGSWVLIVLLFFFPPAELLKRRITASEITFLDVGQGSSTFLQLPSGRRLLIDGGGSSSPGFNVGEDLIAPFLWHRGIKALDAIIITHADADHYNGIPFLLRRFRPKTLWVNELSGHDEAWRRMLTLAAELRIEVKIPRTGEQVFHSGEAGIVHLGNPADVKTAKSNDQSLILRFEDQDLSCLFAGDISQDTESQLVNNNFPLQSSLLLSPHHGSSGSNSEPFLKAVNPQNIVVSAGRFRPDHFPAPEVRQRCNMLGIKMLITAEQGAITFTGKDVNFSVKSKFY